MFMNVILFLKLLVLKHISSEVHSKTTDVSILAVFDAMEPKSSPEKRKKHDFGAANFYNFGMDKQCWILNSSVQILD